MGNLSKRETVILAFGGVFLTIFITGQFIFKPAFEKRETLGRMLRDKQTAVRDMRVLEQELQAVSNRSGANAVQAGKKPKGFSLFSFLDLHAQKSGVKEHVVYMKPFTKKMENDAYALATVKVKLERVHLKALIDFLYQIESSKNGVSVISLSLTRSGKKKKKLDALIETQTLMPKDGQ